MIYLNMWCWLVLFISSSWGAVVPGRTGCPEGYILWPVDLTCHRPYYQGPCGPGEVLIDQLQGPSCSSLGDVQIPQQDDVWMIGNGINGVPNSIDSKDDLSPVVQFEESWSLPGGHHGYITQEEADCLSRDQVWWPGDGQCYSLLEQGPCEVGHWLVLSQSQAGDKVVCKRRICPCDPTQPDLCEVEVEDGGPCKCRVALAAAQDGLCQPGEQMLVSPYGFGVCGCIVSPPHTVWPGDDRCYPVNSQGPCDSGFVLSISRSSMEPVCLPSVCGRGKVTYQGECHSLGSRGPCGEVETLQLDQDTLEPVCTVTTSKVKRVYDIIPQNRGLILDGPLANSLRVNNCKMDSQGKCRKAFFVRPSRRQGISRDRGVKLYIRKRSPRRYLKWLKSFRKKRN